jgi:hypothetical protein
MAAARRLFLLFAALSLAVSGCTAKRAQEASPAMAILYASTAHGEPTRILVRDISRGSDRLLYTDIFGGLKQRAFARWLGSPDGRWVALADQTRIEVAPATRPLSLRRVASRTTFNDRVGGVLWGRGPGGYQLFYIEHRRDRRRPSVERERRLFAVTPDGKHRALIGVFRQREAFGLMGVDLQKRLTYWLKSGEGGFASFVAVDIDSGRVRPVMSEDRLLAAFAFVMAPDLRSVFYVEGGRRIIQRPLLQGSPRVLYRMRQVAEGEMALHGPIVAPDGRALVFVESVDERDRTFLLTLPNAKATLLSQRTRGNEIFGPTSWSPDGRYLWVEPPGPPEPSFVMDLSTKQATVIRGKPQEEAPKYRRFPAIRFLAWLRVR